ncbi:Peroxidase [Actinidia chinensis var. chinensis]|uniref:Peroxidase n=1 Tax=Actinidia chinensis var. chinensis TaxID=1590841 RepID=A0A2R6PIE8_ACTCC|nr:Peroxidase [Actinidia chinensis var. chinensis]
MNSPPILLIVLILIFHGLGSYSGPLVLDYYREKCPLVEEIVARNVEIAVLRDPRMAASLLRLHFHDCFVLGCDASVLLDNYGNIISEKQAGPNINSLRGFEVIDEIKYILEEACPYTVSCADILALAARDAVVSRGGPTWNVHLGRRDSIKASLDDANKYLPAPNSSLEALIVNFQQQGLDTGDLVALSGSHTMGKARCLSFRQRIYDDNSEEQLYHPRRGNTYRQILRSICPKSGGDNVFTPLDSLTPARFDNHYFINIIQGRGLLQSDNVLVTEDDEGEIREHVWAYAKNQDLFFDSFVGSMIKMGSINVITGEEGEIRRNCRYVNT